MDARTKEKFSTRIKPLDEQVGTLRDAFPDLAMPDLGFAARCATPPEADGWFATVSFRKGGDPRRFLRQFVTGRFAKLVPFRNDIGDLTDPSRYGYGGFGGLEHAMTRAMQGEPEIVLFPGTFGGRHPERSAEHVRRFGCPAGGDEFLLGVPDVLSMLLTHPLRLNSPDAPALVCAADLVRLPGRNRNEVPVISRMDEDRLLLTSIKETDTATCLSTPTGFVPILRDEQAATA